MFHSVHLAQAETTQFRLGSTPTDDLYVFGNLSMDTLDYAGPAVNEGSKGVLLGIGEAIRDLPSAFSGELPAGFPAAEAFCRGCLVVTAPPYETEVAAAERIASADSLQSCRQTNGGTPSLRDKR